MSLKNAHLTFFKDIFAFFLNKQTPIIYHILLLDLNIVLLLFNFYKAKVLQSIFESIFFPRKNFTSLFSNNKVKQKQILLLRLTTKLQCLMKNFGDVFKAFWFEINFRMNTAVFPIDLSCRQAMYVPQKSFNWSVGRHVEVWFKGSLRWSNLF